MDLEQAKQARKYERAKEGEAREARNNGAGGAAGEPEDGSGGRGISAGDGGGEHPEVREESPKESTGESAELPSTDREKRVTDKRRFEQEVEKVADWRTHAVGVGGRIHDTCPAHSGAPTDRAWQRELDQHNKRDTSKRRDLQ